MEGKFEGFGQLPLYFVELIVPSLCCTCLIVKYFMIRFIKWCFGFAHSLHVWHKYVRILYIEQG